MFDSNEETCWNSDQGESQWVVLEFPQPVKVSELRLQFQGGFSGKSCKLQGSAKEEDLKHIVDFYPEDNNCLQSFPIQDAPLVQRLKIVFENSADFFGRIIVYTLDILGEKVLECFEKRTTRKYEEAGMPTNFHHPPLLSPLDEEFISTYSQEKHTLMLLLISFPLFLQRDYGLYSHQVKTHVLHVCKNVF
ncbi:nuclear receptor 2C2-associated protein-like isoform X2 [Sinocyclocheilus anshuiensis]|nr:PREDICTED: nuclear receptor 2C2-associated protein-like isoform X2 [Sinocyclocheilus anshuiensis]